jgi:hypothetical protein
LTGIRLLFLFVFTTVQASRSRSFEPLRTVVVRIYRSSNLPDWDDIYEPSEPDHSKSLVSSSRTILAPKSASVIDFTAGTASSDEGLARVMACALKATFFLVG